MRVEGDEVLKDTVGLFEEVFDAQAQGGEDGFRHVDGNARCGCCDPYCFARGGAGLEGERGGEAAGEEGDG